MNDSFKKLQSLRARRAWQSPEHTRGLAAPSYAGLAMTLKSFLLLILILLVSAPAFAKPKAQKPADRSVYHNNQGVTALYQGDLDRALFEFQTATELSPNYVEAWNNLGLAYKSKGNLEKAIQVLKKAQTLDKKYAPPFNHLGTVYYNLGKYDEAIAQFKQALKLNKNFSDAFYNLGITYVAMHKKSGDSSKLQEAVTAFTKATDSNPEHPYAHNELAKVYQAQGEFDKAIIRYKLALEINPKLTESWISLSTLYNQTGETLKAQQALSHANSQDSESPMAMLNMGISYMTEKNYTLALKQFDQVISLMPTNELAYFNAGLAHLQMGLEIKNKGGRDAAASRFEQATRAFESALMLKPTFAEAAYNLGYTAQAGGNLADAKKAFEKTLSIDPNFQRALYALGEIYLTEKDSQKSASYFCKLLKQKKIDLPIDRARIEQQAQSAGGCK